MANTHFTSHKAIFTAVFPISLTAFFWDDC